jgi:protein subunit release factor A
MYFLTKEQKLANYNEQYENKARKFQNLKAELINMQKKIKLLEQISETAQESGTTSRFSLPKIGN